MAGRRDVWNALNRLKAALAASSGGAVGNAAAADVVSGKTFSSATAGTGVSGTNTKNATVPNDAPIQPPQAFVDMFTALLPNATDISRGILFFPTNTASVNIDFLEWWFSVITGGDIGDFHASGAAITNTNAILAWYAGKNVIPAYDGIIDLSGGTNAAPTGQGLTDKQSIIDNGWTVTTN